MNDPSAPDDPGMNDTQPVVRLPSSIRGAQRGCGAERTAHCLGRLRLLFLGCFCFLFLVATGIPSQPAEAAKLVRQSITVAGVKRFYYLYVPSPLVGLTGANLLVVLHGGEGNGMRVENQSNMIQYADELGFLAVFPDAGTRPWNDGRESTRGGGDDVGFLNALVDLLVKSKSVDPTRVFVAGVSNGGMMAQRLACESNRFAGFAAIVAHMPADLLPKCHPPGVPIVLFPGTADPIMPYGGGQISSSGDQGEGGTVVSAVRTVDFWATASGCDHELSSQLPIKKNDGTKVLLHDFANCEDNVLVYEIVGGGHTWPGHGEGSLTTGKVSYNIDATQALLDFFQEHGFLSTAPTGNAKAGGHDR